MSLFDEILLDQDIICRALTLIQTLFENGHDFKFFTKEMRDRLPILLKKEHEKLYLLERNQNKWKVF